MATSTWIADGAHGNLASTAANWDVIPSAGRDVLFNNSSVVNSTWDLAVTVGTFTAAANYSGTITLGVSLVTTGAISLLGGGFVPGGGAYSITCGGNWDSSGSTWTPQGCTVIMPNAGTSIKVKAGYGNAFKNLQLTAISGTYTLLSNIILSDWGTFGVLTGAGATLACGIYSLTVYWSGATPGLAGTGKITGAGLLGFYLPANCTVLRSTGWTIEMPIWIVASGGTYAGTLSADIITTGTILILGALTLSTGAYFLRGTGLTVDATATFNQNSFLIIEGTANVAGGTWAVNENATVDALTQSGGTITVAAGKVLYYEKTISQTGGSSSGSIVQFQVRKQPVANRSSDVTRLD